MRNLFSLILLSLISVVSSAQFTISGEVVSATDGEPLIGASVVIKGTTIGTISDYEGGFSIKVDIDEAVMLEISYVGYQTTEVMASTEDLISIKLVEDVSVLEAVEVKGRRISEKKQESPLTVESLDIIAIKETPAANFYDGLGALKDVDLTSASLGFKIINTRGFNSTSPVRSLQIIDGVDNQSPGLNFSLGNFLGASELDIQKVDIIVGASSSYYGPGAFNGVISMQTKDPFIHRGLSALTKVGERDLFEGGIRYANVTKNKNGEDAFAFKLNLFYLSADDWQAQNYSPVYDTGIPADNPGRFDAVNIYGDEYYTLNDVTNSDTWFWTDAGLGQFHRTGYREVDLVSYDTRNYKGNLALHYRLNPSAGFESTEIIASTSAGGGTTVYQGDNRFSLRNIRFFQHRLELRKKDKFFVRAYMTHENAGDSYDPYFTAIKMQEAVKDNETWALDYRRHWKAIENYPRQMREMGYPAVQAIFNPETNMFEFDFDFEAANQWLANNKDLLTQWHLLARDYADEPNPLDAETRSRLVPGTPAFQETFDMITSSKSNEEEDGTLFYDRSALYHIHGEYQFDVKGLDNVTAGGNGRLYRPDTDGTIFVDTAGRKISLWEFGIYGGVTKKFFENKLSTNVTFRMDKNQNLNAIFTPSASLVYTPKANNYFRLSFASAIRNPTLSNQYLNLNVGPAILAGNIDGVRDLITVESFIDYLGSRLNSDIEFFDIDPIKPERVRTIEAGYRTILFDKLYADASFYNSVYEDFLGFLIGIRSDIDFNDPLSFPENTTVLRYAANSDTKVTTRGFSFGLNYYFSQYYVVNGNYSFNKLVKSDSDDPIIPAFNTPESKFNLGFAARDLPLSSGFARTWGFNINYKYVEGFIFEGSPQFTGFIDSYDLLDAQVNVSFAKINTTLKVGASNILKNEHYETYGGPLIGRLGYVSLLYEFNDIN